MVHHFFWQLGGSFQAPSSCAKWRSNSHPAAGRRTDAITVKHQVQMRLINRTLVPWLLLLLLLLLLFSVCLYLCYMMLTCFEMFLLLYPVMFEGPPPASEAMVRAVSLGHVGAPQSWSRTWHRLEWKKTFMLNLYIRHVLLLNWWLKNFINFFHFHGEKGLVPCCLAILELSLKEKWPIGLGSQGANATASGSVVLALHAAQPTSIHQPWPVLWKCCHSGNQSRVAESNSRQVPQKTSWGTLCALKYESFLWSPNQ